MTIYINTFTNREQIINICITKERTCSKEGAYVHKPWYPFNIPASAAAAAATFHTPNMYDTGL